MPDESPHVLYVAWGFPPCRAGGVYRALATANAFARAGCRVTVLTAEREAFERYTGTDPSMEEQVDESIEVVRIPFDWPGMESDLRRWSAARVFAPRLWRKWRAKEDQKDFPEAAYGPWWGPLRAAALQIHARDAVDLVVATANPNVDFAAAQILNEQHGVPYVMDYRDAWMLDVFDGSLLHEEGGRVEQLERSLLEKSSEVWFVNEPIRAWHAERHPDIADRMHVVANGYDPEFAPEPQLEAPPADKPLSFGYIGTVSPKVPLAEFAEGWRVAHERHPELATATAQVRGYLGFYSTPSPVLLNLIDEYSDVNLSYGGPVPKAEVRQVYENFDVCLLILGAGKYVTSGKVFEYTSTALPIVSVHDPGNAASDVLRDYPLWFPVDDLEPESIARALEAAAEAARNATPEVRQACRDYSLTFARDLQLQPRVEALRELAGGRDSLEGRTA
ncbi:glycosyl transferase [Knoellia sinensis KCTC 19936]|uniref:Glycosyl transferase n=1 Tax=Knoellia sinensis KCTC 19936 TaxID=1385520 RepID=A0A0A0J9X9_9MICO|nr:glycosyltransferase [Knoellia sinensis]KGN32406.1 glycosyl transferase [Knoellia sinensis KCTC 19936]